MKYKLSNNIKENKIINIEVIKPLLLLFFFLNFFCIYAQTNNDSIVFLRVNYKDAIAIHEGESTNPNGISGPNYTKNNSLNSLLTKYRVAYYAPFYSKGVLNLKLKNYYSIHLGENVQAFITELTNLGLTNDIEILNHSKLTCNNPVTINDSWLVNGWANSDAINFINAKCAWTISKGDNTLRVAIADTEFEETHNDLKDNIREVYGPITAQHPHGTYVLGVAGSTPNNTGIIGAGYNLKWDCSRVPHINLSGAATGDPSVAITNAVNKGARVINVSWEDSHYTPEAMQDLVDRGFVIVLGAGNDNLYQYHKNIGKIKGVILVGGVDKFGYHGPTNFQRNNEIDLCTIATGVQSTDLGNGYLMTSGTSFAAPQVSATAGLILSINPCFTPAQVEYIIKSTTKPILDASNYPGLLGTGYLDMYAALKYASGMSSKSIAKNEIWINQEIINGNIIIPSGVTLTIKGKVLCYPDASFTVKSGGKLIIDGGNLSGFCKLWKGIRVEGNSNKDQSLANVGLLEMKNNAIITDANDAVSLIGLNNSGNIDWSKSGGLIKASNSQFLNNKRDVEFMSYHPKNISGVELPNYSYFTNCKFSTDDDRKFKIFSSSGQCHVTLYDVNGVKFSGCIFENISFSQRDVVQARTGIYTVNSSYSIESYCNNNIIPCLPISSKFVELNSAIKSYGNGTLGNISIKNAEFNTYNGIFLMGTNGAQINANTFKIQHVLLGVLNKTDYPYGVYLDECQRFNTEGNFFNGVKSIWGLAGGPPNFNKEGAAGLVIRNTGANNNEFYRSYFNNLRIASQTLGNNKNTNIAGLEFRCNDYKECWDDLHIMNSNNTVSLNFSGIKENQWRVDNKTGKIIIPKNQFTNNINVLNFTLENNILSNIDYAFSGASNISNRYYPSKNTGLYVSTLQVASTDETCPSKLINWGLGRDQMNLKLGELLPTLTVKNKEFNSLSDNGNTDSLKICINNVNNENIENLVNQLFACSPYLSEEVLALIAEQNTPFTNKMIRDLLIANPHSSRNIFVMEKLTSRFNKLPEEYIEQIKNQSNIFTIRDEKKNELSNITTDYDFNLNELLYSYESDTNATILDYANLMKHPSNPSYHYQLAEKLFEQGDLNNYLNVMDSIPEAIKFSNKQSEYHQTFKDLYQKLTEWKQSGTSLYEPNLEIKGWLLDFVQNHNEYPSRIHSLLAINDTFICQADVYMPIGNLNAAESVKLNTTNLEQENKESEINLYPNPAKEIIILEWKSNAKPSQIIVTDLQGKTLFQKHWNMEEKCVLLTQNFANGIYFVKITSDDNKENILRKVIVNR